MSARSFVGFCGSRSLPAVASSFVSRVVASGVGRSFGVAVGCASGADAAALVARLALPFGSSTSGPGLVVFSAFGPGGEGAWRASAVPAVQRAAKLAVSPGHGCSAPVSVRWWAGGSGRLVPRLKARSAALVSFLAGRGRSGLVAFVGGGVGSLSGFVGHSAGRGSVGCAGRGVPVSWCCSSWGVVSLLLCGVRLLSVVVFGDCLRWLGGVVRVVGCLRVVVLFGGLVSVGCRLARTGGSSSGLYFWLRAYSYPFVFSSCSTSPTRIDEI